MINNNEFEFDNSKSYIDINKHLLYLKNVKDIVDEFKYCKICNVDDYATGDKFYALIVSKTNKSISNIILHKHKNDSTDLKQNALVSMSSRQQL